MNQKSVGLTSRAAILALAFIMVASLGLLPLDGVAHAQTPPPLRAVVDPGGTSVSLTWDAIAGAASYRLAKDAGGAPWNYTYIDVPPSDGTSYDDDQVVAGEVYNYYVQSVAADGTMGGWVGPARVELPGGAPALTTAPGNLTVIPDGLTAVDVSWDQVTGAASYSIYRWDGTAGTWIHNLTGSSHKDSNLVSGTTYSYNIRAVNSAGAVGPWSGYQSVTLDTATAEPVLSLTHTSREVVDLEWTQVAGTGVEYDLERMTDVSGGAVSDVDWARLPGALLSVREYTDNTATYVGGSITTRYHYRVRAVVDGTEGEWSNEVSVPIPATGSIPAAPEPRVTSTDLRSITVAWDAVEDVTSYELRFKVEDGEFSDPITRTSTSYRHTGLTRGTKYTYEVRSKNVNGYSEWSDSVSGETAGQEQSGEGSLSIPSNLRVANATDKSRDKGERIGLKLTWSPVSKATGYDIMVWHPALNEWRYVSEIGTVPDPNPNGVVKTLTGSNVTFKGKIGVDSVTGATRAADVNNTITLAAGAAYYFVILAVKLADGELDMSNWSTPAHGIAKHLKPDPPKDLKAITTGSTSIWLSWMAPDKDGTKNPTGYTISFSSGAGSGSINVSGTEYAHTDLRPGTDYYYRVRATNSNSSPSDWEPSKSSQPTQVKATTAPRDLDMPTGLKAADATDLTTTVDYDFDGDGSAETVNVPGVKVSWGKVSGASSYEVQRWDRAMSKWVSLGTTSKTNLTDAYVADDATDTDSDPQNLIAPGMSYHYIVRATNGEITSPWSESVKGLTRGAASTDYMPALTLIPTGQTLVRLTWTGVSGATAYELEYEAGNRNATYFNDDRNDRSSEELSGSPRYFVHSGRDPGTRYSYRMRAILPHTKSDWSNVAQVVTRPATPGLSAAVTKDADGNAVSGSITLTWDRVSVAGAIDVSGALASPLVVAGGYEVFQRQATGAADTTWGDTALTIDPTCSSATGKCTHTVTGLTDDQMYYFRIRVSLNGGELGAPATSTTDPVTLQGVGTDDTTAPGPITSYWAMAKVTPEAP